MKRLEDRQRGCLLGLAIGDALGAAVEFSPPGTFKPVTGYRAGGPHGLNPGEWTDDTSMALALADSIAEAGWNVNDQARRYVRWWRDGDYSVNGRCFDIGITTRSALSRFEQAGDARSSGDPSERASGNGSIMRLGPVAIRYTHLFPDQIDELTRWAAESSLLTHASPQCLSACRYFALILAGLIQGVGRDEVLSPNWRPLEQLRALEPLHPEIEAVAAGSFRERRPPAIQGSGYVVKSLEAALWAFHDAADAREAILRAVNLGDDADTTGAVCGQLAGACWGESGIPAEWLEGLARRDLIENALAGLFQPKTGARSIGRSGVVEGSSLSETTSQEIAPEWFPARPEFLTRNSAHKAQNEAAVERALQMARQGDIRGLRAMPLPPSPKVWSWHGELVGEVERQLAAGKSAAPGRTPPTTSSYWVDPGRLLAGAYPGAPTESTHREKVEALLAAGVRVFVSLMEADETNHAGKPFRPYENLVHELCPQTTCVHFAVRDLCVPSVEDMTTILDTIDGFLDADKIVYVHCWGGVGRTGTVVACWLLRHGRATPEDVLTALAALRRADRERGHRDSPESPVQKEFVRSWTESESAAPKSSAGIGAAVQGTASVRSESEPVPFRPTAAAAGALRELLARYSYMDGFREGPCGKNRLTATESALWATIYELRRLLGEVKSSEVRSSEDAGSRLAELWDLLTDGVLRSLVLARGGVDWTTEE